MKRAVVRSGEPEERVGGMRRVHACAVALAGIVSLVGTTASAQSRDFDVERFTPAPDGDGFLTVPGTRTPGPFRWNAALYLSYAREPLVLRTSDGARDALVGDRLDGSLLVQLGLLGRFAVVLQAPVALWQSGTPALLDGGGPLMVSAVRDPRLSVRARLLGEDATEERARHEGEGLAVELATTLPIGQRDAYAGEGAAQLTGAVIADFHILDLGFGAMVGYRHRFAEPSILGSSFRNQLYGVLAVQVPLFFVDRVSALAELDVTTDLESPFGNAGSTASEWRAGFRISAIRDVEITAAAGSGVSDGAGATAFRGVVGVSFAPRVHDRDHDGIVDDRDGCITLPEDFDQHADDDGCPEPDNDGDLVPDLDDRCPDAAADFGHDADDDGCNDPVVDADQDGLADPDDACPRAPEDRDGVQDDDGCPDPDDDGDGVADRRDRCLGELEDRDGFEDGDGCPDPDDDGDGLLDASDRCPRLAEDIDAHDDGDGCPDVDDDHDGVLDASDRCPGELETINGVTDDDGCADRGRAAWTPVRARRGEDAAPRFRGRIRVRADGTLDGATDGALRQLARIAIASERPLELSIGVAEAESAAAVRALRARLRVVTCEAAAALCRPARPRDAVVVRVRRDAALRVGMADVHVAAPVIPVVAGRSAAASAIAAPRPPSAAAVTATAVEAPSPPDDAADATADSPESSD